MIRYSRHGARTFLPSQAFHKMYTFARRQSKAAPLAGTARPKDRRKLCADEFRAEPGVVIPVRDVGDEIRMDDLEGEAEKGSWRKLSWQVTLKIVYRIDVANFRLVYFNFSNLKYTFETILGWLSLIIILMNYWYLQSREKENSEIKNFVKKNSYFKFPPLLLLNFSEEREREVNKHRV